MRGSRLITLTCYASFLGLGLAGTLLGPTFQSLTTRFNIALQDAGIFTVLVFAGATLSGPFYGRLLDRIDVRYILCGGAFLMGSGLLLLSIAPTLPIALLATLCLGLGSGALIIAPNVVIVHLNPDNAAGSLNFLNVFYGVGAIAGPQLVNFALSHNNFDLAFRAAAAFMLLLVIPFGMSSLHLHHADSGHTPPSIVWITLLPFAMLSFIYVGTETGIGSWLFTQLRMVSLSSEATATIATSIFYAGLTVGRVIGGFLSRRVTEKQLLLISFVVLGIGIIALLSAPLVINLAIISAFVVGLGCGPVSPTIIALTTNAYPTARGTVLGVTSAGGSIGGALLTWLQGQVGGGQNGGMIVPLISTVVMLAILFTVIKSPTAAAPTVEGTTQGAD